jgi:hypothetical protein
MISSSTLSLGHYVQVLVPCGCGFINTKNDKFVIINFYFCAERVAVNGGHSVMEEDTKSSQVP